MDLNSCIKNLTMEFVMKRWIKIAVLLVVSVGFNIANAALVFSFSPTPLISTADAVLTIRSGWQERIQIFPGGGYAANIVVSGNIVNLDVVGGGGIFVLPGISTHTVNLGQLAAGAYQLRLRYRDEPPQLGVFGQVYPGVAGRIDFTVEPGPALVTQIPGLTSNSSILLSLLVLAIGGFAIRRQ
jgi:hypothetical protein